MRRLVFSNLPVAVCGSSGTTTTSSGSHHLATLPSYSASTDAGSTGDCLRKTSRCRSALAPEPRSPVSALARATSLFSIVAVPNVHLTVFGKALIALDIPPNREAQDHLKVMLVESSDDLSGALMHLSDAETIAAGGENARLVEHFDCKRIAGESRMNFNALCRPDSPSLSRCRLVLFRTR